MKNVMSSLDFNLLSKLFCRQKENLTKKKKRVQHFQNLEIIMTKKNPTYLCLPTLNLLN